MGYQFMQEFQSGGYVGAGVQCDEFCDGTHRDGMIDTKWKTNPLTRQAHRRT